LIVNNNEVFGLTAGQQSSATPKGALARATNSEAKNQPLSVVDLAATSGANFIARVPETDLKMMAEIIEKAIVFEGFSVIEIIQPCKIWAKRFPQRTFEKISKPFKNRIELIGKENIAGLLFIKK
jgi:2-oxoglutarate ferredoxin oxidoreductase subunit beta